MRTLLSTQRAIALAMVLAPMMVVGALYGGWSLLSTDEGDDIEQRLVSEAHVQESPEPIDQSAESSSGSEQRGPWPWDELETPCLLSPELVERLLDSSPPSDYHPPLTPPTQEPEFVFVWPESEPVPFTPPEDSERSDWPHHGLTPPGPYPSGGWNLPIPPQMVPSFFDSRDSYRPPLTPSPQWPQWDESESPDRICLLPLRTWP